MRRNTEPAHLGDKTRRIIGLVRTQGDAPAGRQITHHINRRRALRGAGRCGQPGVHDQPVAVFHQRMPHVAEHRDLTRGLAIQPGVRIDGGGVRLVAASLTTEIALAIASRAGRFTAAVLRAEVFS